MNLSGVGHGSWTLRSKSDPRWNRSGDAHGTTGVMVDEAKAALEELKELYGEPPEDLMYSFMKD